jgi:hypothetical protein
MRKLLLIAGLALLLIPGFAWGLSYSVASGYGSAAHLDDQEYMAEWFGADGSLIDGFNFAQFTIGGAATLSFDVSLNNFFDNGSNEWLSIWADWNQDQIFADNEMVYGINDYWFDNGTTTMFAQFVVPDYAILGETWMRARVTYDGPLMATGDYFTGEVEDYRINVRDRSQAVIPEPATIALFGLGLAGVGFVTRRNSN